MVDLEQFMSDSNYIEFLNINSRDRRRINTDKLIDITNGFAKVTKYDRVMAVQNLSSYTAAKLLSLSGGMAELAIDESRRYTLNPAW